jgi:hypothetical protein
MKKIILMISFFTVLYSCKKDMVDDDNVTALNCEDTISYAQDIQPFLDINCSTSGCHNSTTNAAGYVFEDFEDASLHADIILNVIRHDAGFSPMPQGGAKLSDAIIQQMECWVDQGKLNN